MMTKKGRPNAWKGDSLSDQSDGLGGAFAFSNLSVGCLPSVVRSIAFRRNPFVQIPAKLRTSIRLLNDALLTAPFSSSKTHEKSPDQQLSIRTQ